MEPRSEKFDYDIRSKWLKLGPINIEDFLGMYSVSLNEILKNYDVEFKANNNFNGLTYVDNYN